MKHHLSVDDWLYIRRFCFYFSMVLWIMPWSCLWYATLGTRLGKTSSKQTITLIVVKINHLQCHLRHFYSIYFWKRTLKIWCNAQGFFFYLKDNFVLIVELYLLSFFIHSMIIISVVSCCWIRFYLNTKSGSHSFDSVYRQFFSFYWILQLEYVKM